MGPNEEHVRSIKYKRAYIIMRTILVRDFVDPKSIEVYKSI